MGVLKEVGDGVVVVCGAFVHIGVGIVVAVVVYIEESEIDIVMWCIGRLQI